MPVGQYLCKSNLDLDNLLDEMKSEVSYAGEKKWPTTEERSLWRRDLEQKSVKEIWCYRGENIGHLQKELKTSPSL